MSDTSVHNKFRPTELVQLKAKNNEISSKKPDTSIVPILTHLCRLYLKAFAINQADPKSLYGYHIYPFNISVKVEM